MITVRRLALRALALCSLSACLAVPAHALTSAQSSYLTAIKAIRQGDRPTVSQLRQQLADYPLAQYIDYYDLLQQMDPSRVAEANTFIQRDPQGLLAGRVKSRYLRMLADNARWDDFVKLAGSEPRDLGLRCRYYEARWNQGDQQPAYAFADDIWMHDASRPGECNGLFRLWQDAGLMTSDKIWQRMQLVFANNDMDSMIDYLSRQLAGTPLEADAQRVLALYRQPDALASLLPAQARDASALAVLTLQRYARQDPRKALVLYNQVNKPFAFTSEQVIAIEGALARQFLRNRDPDAQIWVDNALRRQHDPSLIELRLRQAVWDSDWAGVKRWVQRIPDVSRSDVRWTYWLARAEEAQGHAQHARALYRQASYERSYYGFLAADRVGADIPLNMAPLPAPLTLSAAIQKWPAVARVRELLAIQDTDQARSEWTFLMDAVAQDDKLRLGGMALQQGWADLAVLSSIRAKAWDVLPLRFPTPMNTLFVRFAREQNLDPGLLYALARQESALYPKARSPVGASGLMQLMPTTAAHVAKKNGLSYGGSDQLIQPEVNLQLGSAYLRELLDNYNGNRILAAAAYNAGPGRVRQWRQNSAGREMDVWVENIPFTETRNYVQNVLVFNSIYQHQLRKSPQFLTENERTMRY